MRIQENNKFGQLYINLPKAVIDALGWKKGCEINIQITNKNCLLIKKKEGDVNDERNRTGET